MRKSKKLLILIMCVSIIFSGCGAVVGGGMVAKALSWLTFWKKDDVSTSGMTETERMKSAFSEYTGIIECYDNGLFLTDEDTWNCENERISDF